MAKDISRRNIMKCSLLLLLVLFLVEMQVRSTLAIATTEVILQNTHNCGSMREVNSSDTRTFNVSLQWARPDTNCSIHQRGFYCSTTFIQKDDEFANLGTRLCVDIQGVQLDIADMSQLLVTVYDRNRDMKKIYANTRLRPKDAPYYECADPKSHSISVALSVRQSVRMCPHILEDLYNNKIRLGSVLSRPIHPITEVSLAKCRSSGFSMSDSNLVKVDANGMTGECSMVKALHHPYSYMKGCITLKYLSNEFECDVVVSLYSKQGNNAIQFPMNRMHGGETQLCNDFEGRRGFPMLDIRAYANDFRPCRGVFAFQVDFRVRAPPDTHDDKPSSSPNLYMAVFITLIAICLVCLGLTCLCCIRFRAKRLRRLQQRSRHRHGTASNQGFQRDLGSPPNDGIGWNPSQPAMLFGLPSYDDVVGGGGVNPSGDAYKNDLPPSYDSVCSPAEN